VKSLSNSFLFKNPSELCQIGEYKLAARNLLKARKTQGIGKDRNSNILPVALCKAGRYRSAAGVCIFLIAEYKLSIDEGCSILSEILSNYNVGDSDLESALQAVGHLHLSKVNIGILAASFSNETLQNKFLDWAVSKYDLAIRDCLFVQASIAYQQGNSLKAMKLLQDHQDLGAYDRDAAMLSAKILNENHYLNEAKRYCCIVLRANSSDIGALNLLGQVLYQQSRWLAAKRIYSRVHMLTGDCISLLNADFTLPRIASSTNELRLALNEFSSKLESFPSTDNLRAIEESLRLCNPICHSFYLAYQGSIQLRPFLERYYDIIRAVTKSILEKVHSAYCRANLAHERVDNRVQAHKYITTHRRKIKIGFVSRHFSNHSNLQAHAGLIRHLDKSDFEVNLIHRHGTRMDQSHETLNSYSDNVIYLNGDYALSCKTLASLSLDILFFTDIGMYPLDCALAMVQAAPFQVTSWGSPHTSGLKEIDYHLRSSIFCDCESENDYTEKLISLDGYLGYFEVDRSLLEKKPRDYFLLPPDRFLIGCLQSLHKIHPDFDFYLEDICKLDPSIMIVVAASENDALNHKFARRLRRRAPTAYGQICFVQKMSLGDYYSLNYNFDLNLDPVHYGAGITFVESAWCGPPCITQRGTTVRSSVVSRSYEYANITNAPIVSNRREYVALVEHLFNNRNELNKLRKEIYLKSHGTIYENSDYLKSNSNFLIGLAGKIGQMSFRAYSN
jgi:hypothetical protein